MGFARPAKEREICLLQLQESETLICSVRDICRFITPISLPWQHTSTAARCQWKLAPPSEVDLQTTSVQFFAGPGGWDGDEGVVEVFGRDDGSVWQVKDLVSVHVISEGSGG